MTITRIQLRRGTTAQWATANPILAPGEPGVDENPDSGGLKLGDGETPWIDLPFSGGAIPTTLTADTGERFKTILFSNGTVRAVPIDAVAPAAPTGLSASVALTKVVLTWTAAARASTYQVIRDGSVLTSGIGSTSYTDYTVVPSHTYHYSVRAYDAYGQPSPTTVIVPAFIDPALDHPPVVSVTVFPNPIPQGGTAIVRVNGFPPDDQALAFTLGVDAGQLQATADPSVWLFTI